MKLDHFGDFLKIRKFKVYGQNKKEFEMKKQCTKLFKMTADAMEYSLKKIKYWNMSALKVEFYMIAVSMVRTKSFSSLERGWIFTTIKIVPLTCPSITNGLTIYPYLFK